MSDLCPCECNSGGFCGGCGHAGCSGGINVGLAEINRCRQCQRQMNPVEWMMGSVCGRCVRENHAKVVGNGR
jgi:hypothetical protein